MRTDTEAESPVSLSAVAAVACLINRRFRTKIAVISRRNNVTALSRCFHRAFCQYGCVAEERGGGGGGGVAALIDRSAGSPTGC